MLKSENLIELGLTNGEAKVYMALLSLGSTTVGPIVKESKIAYSNIYEVLDRLSEKGLVSFILKEKTKFFQASEPYQLEKYIENKQDEINEQKKKLKNLMPSIISLAESKEEKLEAEVFSGYKGVKTSFLKLLEGGEGDYLFFYNYQGHYERLEEFFLSLIPKFDNPKIRHRGLLHRSYWEESEFMKQTQFMDIKLIDFPIVGNVDIFNDKVLITAWSEKPVSFLIHSKQVAKNMTEYFNFVWETAK